MTREEPLSLALRGALAVGAVATTSFLFLLLGAQYSNEQGNPDRLGMTRDRSDRAARLLVILSVAPGLTRSGEIAGRKHATFFTASPLTCGTGFTLEEGPRRVDFQAKFQCKCD